MLVLRKIMPCLALVLLALVSCTKSDVEPLTVGFNPWPGYEFVYLAEELGYYDKLGLDVKLVELSSLGDVSRSFAKGQIDSKRLIGAPLPSL